MISRTVKTYGDQLSARELESFLDFTMKQNDKLAREGRRGIPICIWGTHGLGKTETVISFAQRNNYTYVYCAPAQFEEMGDLHGIPETYDPHPEIPGSGDEYTVYRPPEWLRAAIEHADEEKPGILILDDFNRAEARIIQGCMQLLQMHALFSWSLPPRWQIILTANPEGGAYTVTEMDDAMLTRMIHVTMRFDVRCWVEWATTVGLDSRGIDFLLSYPAAVTGMRTTARSFTQFLQQIAGITDLSRPENIRLVQILGRGTLDMETVDLFLHFCQFVHIVLLQPEEILDADNFTEDILPRLRKIVSGEGYKRADLLNTICTRLQLHLTAEKYRYSERHKENLLAFLLNEEMDQSLRFRVHHHLSNVTGNDDVRKLITDSRLARAILKGM